MPEAVIVATGRTPIGRANKGSLVECRPDDLSALVIKTVLAKVPQLQPAEIRIQWKGIKTNSRAEGLAIRIYLDVVDRVECLPDHRLRQRRIEAWSIRDPSGVVDVLSQSAPLQATAKLQT